jgi:hypothetical protein
MKKDGGPAFPNSSPIVFEGRDVVRVADGMSLRDYFAAAAMPLVALGLKDTPCPAGMTLGQHAAQIAYAIAERMLAERDK